MFESFSRVQPDHWRPALIGLMVMGLAPGCAHVTFDPQIQSLGEYQSTASLVKKARKLSSEEAASVRVLVGTLPDGMRVEHEQLVMDDPGRYTILSQVSAKPDFNKAAMASMGFVPYRYAEDEKWKNVYCNAQVPLVWATLTVWMMIPFHYPCMIMEGNSPSAVERRREAAIDALRKATLASGGNLLVVTGLGDLRTINANTGATLSTLDVASGQGYAILDKQATRP